MDKDKKIVEIKDLQILDRLTGDVKLEAIYEDGTSEIIGVHGSKKDEYNKFIKKDSQVCECCGK